MGSSRVGSNPTCSVLASCSFSFHADGSKSNLTDDRGPSRNSSVGRASDWRSEGPWLNSRFRHYAQLASTLGAQASRPGNGDSFSPIEDKKVQMQNSSWENEKFYEVKLKVSLPPHQIWKEGSGAGFRRSLLHRCWSGHCYAVKIVSDKILIYPFLEWGLRLMVIGNRGRVSPGLLTCCPKSVTAVPPSVPICTLQQENLPQNLGTRATCMLQKIQCWSNSGKVESKNTKMPHKRATFTL